MLPIKLQDNRVHVGMRFSVSFQRTDRLAQGELVRRPVSHGQLPVRPADNSFHTPNTDLNSVNGLIVPCEEDEAVWLGFCGKNSSRIALKIRQGEVNAVTGSDWDDSLHDPQDYLVPPDQTNWFGIARAGRHLRQFTRDPMELVVYEPEHADDPPARAASWDKEFYSVEETPFVPGTTDSRIVPDPLGITLWSSKPTGRVTIYFVDSERWQSLTGEAPPSRTLGYRGTLLP